MWEEGTRIYGIPRVYNNFPVEYYLRVMALISAKIHVYLKKKKNLFFLYYPITFTKYSH